MRQKIKNTLIYLALRCAVRAVRLLPLAWAVRLGGCLGDAFQTLVPKERGRTLEHLALAFPDFTPQQRHNLMRRVFISLGQNAFELLCMSASNSARIIRLVENVTGLEHMRSAQEQGRGVLCLTAHFGNWEILPIFTRQQGWPTAVVAQSLYDPRLDGLLNSFREAHGLLVIKRKQVTRDLIRCLRENYLLGILNDQDTGVDSRFAPFFGLPAKTPVGIFRLARKLGSPVVPIFISRQANGKNRIDIDPALPIPHTADEEADLLECARLCNQVTEKYVRRHPEQWVWFHQRWKSRPGPALEIAPASGPVAGKESIP